MNVYRFHLGATIIIVYVNVELDGLERLGTSGFRSHTENGKRYIGKTQVMTHYMNMGLVCRTSV